MMRNRAPAIYVISLGCAKNLVDTEVMCGGLAVDGYLLTDQPEEADVMLINTCSFIADAREEAEAEIQAALAWKKDGADRRVVVGGCLPQQDLGSARKAYPDVDLFLSLDDVAHIGRRLRELDKGTQTESGEFAESEYIYNHETPRLQLTPANYAYVKIAEGCNHFCRFCAIPGIRGRLRSRPADSILQEIQGFVDQGVKEINLIGQDTTAYGVEREDQASLVSLLRACREIDGDYWLRILYTHPAHFQDQLLEVMAEDPRVLPYIDMPLQHISSTILESMGRRTPSTAIRDRLDRIRTRLPHATLRTTFLVGYPGETEKDYQELRKFVETMRFDRLGVFAFSPEAGTPAAGIKDGLVPAATAAARRAELLTIQQDISLKKNRELIGREIRVLVEGMAEDGDFQGRSAADAPDVDNRVLFEADNPAAGESGFVNVCIREVGPYDLFGVA